MKAQTQGKNQDGPENFAEGKRSGVFKVGGILKENKQSG